MFGSLVVAMHKGKRGHVIPFIFPWRPDLGSGSGARFDFITLDHIPRR